MKLCVREEERDFYFRRGSSDSRVIGQIFHENCYDLRRLRRFEQLIEFAARNRVGGRRPLIVDAGANIGASSVYFAAKFPDALVIAIEPDFGNYELLAENAKGLRISPIHCALSAAEGRVRVIDVGEGFWGYRTRSVAHGEKGIRAITMNRVYELHEAEYFPFIVKIDIEGGEKDLFLRDVEWVDRTPLLIIELHDWLLPSEGSSLSFLRCISQLDRDFVYIGEDVYSIANDLKHRAPGADPATAAGNGPGTMSPSAGLDRQNESEDASPAITALEEPLDEQVLAAMNDFQNEIRILRHTDDELRAALDALNDEKARLQATLTSEHSAANEAQQTLASVVLERTETQEVLRGAQQELATTRQLLTSAEAELANTRHELASAREELGRSQRELSDTRQKLAATEQDQAGLQSREKSLVSELSLAIGSLQHLRDQLHERDRALGDMRRESEGVAAKLAAVQKREAGAKEALQRSKEKLQARNQELGALRQQRLVRLAIRVGSRMNRLSSGFRRPRG